MPTLLRRRRNPRSRCTPRKGDEKDGMGSKPLGGFTAAICMIKDGEKKGKRNGQYSACPCINIHESLVKETNGSHKTCHVLPSELHCTS